MNGFDLSIIAPAHDEEANIAGLVEDVRKGLSGSGLHFEMIVIDDASNDGTRAAIARDSALHDWLRGLALSRTPTGAGNGQSSAFRAGILSARGSLIALMDADRQNDPADIPAMLELLRDRRADMVQGDRSAGRRDSRVKRITSWVGRTFRRTLLGDSIRDTGCSLRILRREVALELPLQFRGMHRFIPFYARLLGYTVVEMPVRHRARTAGSTKYGIRDRALPGLRDLVAVRWMKNRIRDPSSEPIARSELHGDEDSRKQETPRT